MPESFEVAEPGWEFHQNSLFPAEFPVATRIRRVCLAIIWSCQKTRNRKKWNMLKHPPWADPLGHSPLLHSVLLQASPLMGYCGWGVSGRTNFKQHLQFHRKDRCSLLLLFHLLLTCQGIALTHPSCLACTSCYRPGAQQLPCTWLLVLGLGDHGLQWTGSPSCGWLKVQGTAPH